MIYSICILFVLSLSVSAALFVSPYFRERESQGENSTEVHARFLLDNPSHSVYTTGFVRTDSYSRRWKWVRAQVLPIGVCFKKGSSGGSAVIDQIMMGSSYLLRVSNVYSGNDCDGGYQTILLKVPFVKENINFVHIVRHEANMDVKRPSLDGLVIITSYYSSGGCIGEAAQYDLISTAEYIVVDDPIGACGLFECSVEEEMVILKLFDSYQGEIHPYCNPSAYPINEDASSAFTNIKQPFTCTRERVREGEKQVDFPLFQTIRCVSPYQDPTPDVIEGEFKPEQGLLNRIDTYTDDDYYA